MIKDVRKYGISNKRGRQQTNADPFMPEESFKEPSLCMTCKTVYLNQHWTFDPQTYQQLESQRNVNWINCPACQKVAAGFAEGIVTLSGSYLWEHEAEIQQILQNLEHKALTKNPFERVIRRQRYEDKLVIETTEKKLAEHLGRVLHRSHRGKLNISWTSNPDTCRVDWERTL